MGDKKKLAKVYYADLWGPRKKKYDYLVGNDVRTTKWRKIDVQRFEDKFSKTRWAKKYTTGLCFFTPKSLRDILNYGDSWGVDEIFGEWSSGVKTHRDHLLVAFSRKDIMQRLHVFSGNLSNDVVAKTLKLKDTRDWKLDEARKRARDSCPEKRIHRYAYRPFDIREFCYDLCLIDRGCDRWPFMRALIESNVALVLKRSRYLKATEFHHTFAVANVGDINFFGDQSIFFPLYIYPDARAGAIRELPLQEDECEGTIGELPLQQGEKAGATGESPTKLGKDVRATHELPLQGAPEEKGSQRDVREPEGAKSARVPNFTPEFLHAIKTSLGKQPTPEDIFYYIYAVLYSPTYRKRYEEFLKIDFPRIPLPTSRTLFRKLSNLGKKLVELHLLKHPSLADTEVGFPRGDSNIAEKVTYDERNRKVFINKDQYFEGVRAEVWEYRIGAYQVMEKYLKDRKKRKLSLDEINHYMQMAKAIRSTIGLQKKIDEVYGKYKGSLSS